MEKADKDRVIVNVKNILLSLAAVAVFIDSVIVWFFLINA